MERLEIVFLNKGDKTKGEALNKISKKTIASIEKIFKENEFLKIDAGKLQQKSEKLKRESNKLTERIIKTHNIKLEGENSLGISKSDILYVANKERLDLQPDAEPQEGDLIVGKLLKYERRKYDEIMEKYDQLKLKVKEHNAKVYLNEDFLYKLEEDLFKDLDIEKNYKTDYVGIFSTGKTILCKRK